MRHAAWLGLAFFVGAAWNTPLLAAVSIEAEGVVVPSGALPVCVRAPENGFVVSVSVSIGQEVVAGQPVLTLDVFTGDKAAFEKASTAVTAARDQRRWIGRLFEKHMATKQQLAEARASETQAKSALDALRQQDAGRNRQTLTASSPGLVTLILAHPSDRAPAGTPLMSIGSKNPMLVRISVNAAQAASLKPGQPAKLTPVDGGPELDGAVLSGGHVPDPRTGLIEADLSAPATSISPGERLAVKIGLNDPATAVPAKP